AGNTKPTQAPTKAHAAGKKIRLPTYPNHTKLDVVLGRLRKNPLNEAFSVVSIRQGLKPAFILLVLSARLKSCPDTKPRPIEFFRSL
ncbi:MAG: hypothetical protein WBE74_19700, partial [Terracidiphilus sp.]